MLIDNPFALPPDEVMVKVLLPEALFPADIESALRKLIGFGLQGLKDLATPSLLPGE